MTNIKRINNGLSPLSRSDKLSASAAKKVKDMFEKQYFEHISPSGRGVKDLAQEAGYEFIVIGENLALGNFENDESLVQAWMESPGHRDNILNSRFREIGVAVGKGVFEGKSTWIAVQHFGFPVSYCPGPDDNFRDKIEKGENEIIVLQKELKASKAALENMRGTERKKY